MFDFRELGQGSTVPVWRWSDKRMLDAITRMEVVCRVCYRAKRDGTAIRVAELLGLNEPVYPPGASGVSRGQENY